MPKKFPKSMGACADLLYDLREKRLTADKAAAELKMQENALKEHIIDNLDKASTGAIGRHHKVRVIIKPKPQVRDWDAFYKYVKRTGAFELFQRRISEPAIVERTTFDKNEQIKKTVPGIEFFKAVDVSLTKV